jgi:hypothetical protein
MIFSIMTNETVMLSVANKPIILSVVMLNVVSPSSTCSFIPLHIVLYLEFNTNKYQLLPITLSYVVI